jgi:hypothetical protein
MISKYLPACTPEYDAHGAKQAANFYQNVFPHAKHGAKNSAIWLFNVITPACVPI